MKGIIDQVIKKGIKKGKSLQVIRRYLKIKYKISATINVLKKRLKHSKKQTNG
tara:strand:+ start:274 stop:432 length:159 start_codon:yes stop_codon:yes gene_type:complete